MPLRAGTHIPNLRSACSIKPGVTLANIFEAVDRDEELKEFLAQYCWCDVEGFHAEASKPLRGLPVLPEVEHLEISKIVEFDVDGAQEIVKVSGIGKRGAEYPHYGIELASVSELAPLYVELHPLVVVRRDREVLARAPGSFSLLDVLGAIYWEISFHGSPQEHKAFVMSLKEAARKLGSKPPGRILRL